MLSRRSILGGIAASGIVPLVPAIADAPEEQALEPELEIVDAHQHFRDATADVPGYWPEDMLATFRRTGHRVISTVFIECGLHYRKDGPEIERSLGETEFVADVGRRAGHGFVEGIVANVDLRAGAAARTLLERHVAAGTGRLRGIRTCIAYDEFPRLAAFGNDPKRLSEADYRKGFAALAPLGLSADIWLFYHQLGSMLDLARAFPETTFILDHLGNPLGIGPYVDKQAEVRTEWTKGMKALAACPNINVKLGGLGPFSAPPTAPLDSTALAAQWRPWIETAVQLFGPDRAMFESNFPPNGKVGSYSAHWNAFKRITAGWSADEKKKLYSGTAKRVYRLPGAGAKS